MAEDFLKFPRTPHLVWLGGRSPRGDKLLNPTEARALLQRPCSLEEKVDGANLGLSVGSNGRLRAQSRGHYLEPRTEGQWKPLWRWLAVREERLLMGLQPGLILFGEWCYAVHSVAYDSLPDWFLAFDVYDRGPGRFWSRVRRDEWVRTAGLETVPLVGSGNFSLDKLRKQIGPSRLGSVPAEGIYLRWDESEWLVARAKIVRPGWVLASDEHWSSGPLRVNPLAAHGQHGEAGSD